MPTAYGDAVALRPFGLLARMRRTLLVGCVGGVVVVLRSWPRTYTPQGLRPLAMTLAIYAVIMLSMGLIQAVRQRGGGASLRFGDDALFLPLNANTAAGRQIPYGSIRAANFCGGGRWSSLVLDAAGHLHVYPLRRFAAVDGPARVLALLRERLAALPDGAQRWAGIAWLQADAERLRVRRPWAVWSLSAAIVLVYALQLAWPHVVATPDDGLAAIDLGANAASLVRQGQVWRLATAALMHGSGHHLIHTLGSLLVIGTLLERLIGLRQVLLMALLTGLASEAASAVLGRYVGGYIYSVGISGALFGLIGALAVVTWRFGAQLPAGYRLSRRVWYSLLGLNLLITALVPQVDKGAHVGGLLAGATLGWLLFRRARTLPALSAPTRTGDIVLACTAAIWLLSLTGAARHLADPAARLRDRTGLMREALATSHGAPALEHQIAWSVALQPMADDAAWRDARALAARAAHEAASASRSRRLSPLIQDTVAVLDDRLGDTIGAVRQEKSLLPTGNHTFQGHMAQFLEKLSLHGKPAEVAGAFAVPSVSLNNGLLHLRLSEALPRGGELFVLLRRRGAVHAVLDLMLPPSAPRTFDITLRYRAAPEDSTWRDAGATLQVALFDASGCPSCEPSRISGLWYFVTPD